ncbi:MAG: sugar transferase [Nevskia sp.]|nr:sugar transferase [Nevskia sp.]
MGDRAGDLHWTTADTDSTVALTSGREGFLQEAATPATRHEIRFRPYYVVAKRVVDIAGALVLGLVFSPILLIVTFSLNNDGGDILFRHTRVGKGGRAFKVYKFRTMVPNADQVLRELIANNPQLREEWLRDHKLKDDPRVTRIGRFLRKTSLDELPQLWNVLKGEMSLVGPRPVIREELRKYGRAARYYLAVKPGLTGVWQVSGRNDTDYRRRVAMDRRYAGTASLGVDIVVLAKTVDVVLRRRGAY